MSSWSKSSTGLSRRVSSTILRGRSKATWILSWRTFMGSSTILRSILKEETINRARRPLHRYTKANLTCRMPNRSNLCSRGVTFRIRQRFPVITTSSHSFRLSELRTPMFIKINCQTCKRCSLSKTEGSAFSQSRITASNSELCRDLKCMKPTKVR